MIQVEKHPCFSDNCSQYARIHLPVAPLCNISCNYCRKDHSCVNESRPGVTARVLPPEEAVSLYSLAAKSMDNLTVVAIAGPGDALANFPDVYKTLQSIRKKNSGIAFCLSTNGLNLSMYLPQLLELGVKYLTVTVNALDEEIGEKIYDSVLWQGKKLFQKEAFSRLRENQLSGIKQAVDNGIYCKINTVVIPSVNEHHVSDIAKNIAGLGCYMQNLIPFLSIAGTKFGHIKPCDTTTINRLRKECSVYIKQMYHCQRCRADAIGLLHEDRFADFYANF